MRSLALLLVALFLGFSLVFVSKVNAKFEGDAKKRCEENLKSILMNKTLVSKVVFPASKNGINLKIDGLWDTRAATRYIKEYGVGIEIDEKANVTSLKLKDKSIEIHLNGGGYGTLGDMFQDSELKQQMRKAGGKAAGGSRINLDFDRDITEEDIDAKKFINWLNPLVDASQLERVAALDAIPEEFKDAAARKEIINGMPKTVVFAILGEPKNKNVDLDKTPPVEKWQYELDSTTSLLITFEAGKVTSVVKF